MRNVARTSRIKRRASDGVVQGKGGIGRIFAYIGLILLAIICLLPFAIMLLNATQSHVDLSTRLSLLPGSSLVHNYTAMLEAIDIWRYLLNSVLVAVPSVLLTAYIGTLAAYGFEKFEFKGKKLAFGLAMTMMIIPGQISLIGMYQIYADLKMLNTLWTVILPSAANVLTVYWMRSYIYQVIDSALIESATIDGCGELRIFHSIILPLCKTGIMTISIMNFVSIWNDYISPLTFITSKSKYTLPVGIAFYRNESFVDLGAMYMAMAISTLVMVLIYVLFNSQIIGNVADGAVKG